MTIMKRLGVLAVLLMSLSLVASADNIIANTGAAMTGFFSVSGGHTSAYASYLVGTGLGTTRNDFFVFDVPDMPYDITAASITLNQAAGGSSMSSPSLTFTLFDVSTAWQYLTWNFGDGSAQGQAIYADLGSGTALGTVTIDPSTSGNVVISLNAAGIQLVNSSQGQRIVFGGSITSGDGYAFYNYPLTNSSLSVLTSVDDVPVPEPASLVLLGTGLAFAFRRFKR